MNPLFSLALLALPVLAWGAELTGHAEVTGPSDDLRLWVYNDTDTDWEQVMVIVNGSLVCKAEAVPGKAMAELAFKACDGTLEGEVTTVLIQSEQGSVALAGDRLSRVPSPEAPASEPAEGAEPTPAPPPEAEPTPPPPPADLRVRVTVSGGFAAARVLTVHNDGVGSITACKVTINETWHDFLHALGSAQKDRMPLTGFRDSDGKVMKSNVQVHDVDVACEQGSVSVQP